MSFVNCGGISIMSLIILLLNLILLCKRTVAIVDIVDATKTFVKSTESTFDHEVLLFEEGSESITFHWNNINSNTLEGRLIHKAPSADKAPSWVGFGIYDTFKNPEPITSTSKLMIGSEAIIGIVKEQKVEKFKLNDKAVSSVVTSAHQTLVYSDIIQRDSGDGTVTTDLTFEKLIEEDSDDEIRIRHAGTNVFLWAIGPSGTDVFGYHNRRGAFTVDLETVTRGSEQGLEGLTIDQLQGGGNIGSDSNSGSTSDSGLTSSPVVNGECASYLPEAEMMVRLTPHLTFHWTVNAAATPPSVTMILDYDGEAWLGLGVSEDGKMIGSTAIIGKPDEGSVEKYDLTDKSVSAIISSTSQTLHDTSIDQLEGKTKLKFTKLLDENNGQEVVITQKGLNTFLFAVGDSNEFGYHAHRGSFRLDLSACSASIAGTASSSNMEAWATHGTFAVLAWAIASPFAITVAWFRTLVPSSWIYIHVFANVMSFICSLIAVIIALAAMSYDSNPHHFSHPHHILGLVLIVAMTFQVMNGFLRPPVEKRDPYAASQYENNAIIKIPRSPREVWFFSHKSTGIVMAAISVFQITSGLQLFAENFNTKNMEQWYWAYIALFISGLISLKLWIMYEEYKARRGMEATQNLPQGGRAHENDPLPAQYETN